MRLVPGVELSDNVVTYEEQILSDQLPESIIIGGSGAIGVEFAYVMANFGVDVTIVEFLDRMVPTEDADISKELAKHYKKLGVKVLTSTAVKNVEDTGSGVKVTVAPAAGGDEQVLEAGKFLAAFGFAPRVKGYGLENTGVAVSERGAIEIDDFGRTNVDNVYAIGDCTGKMMLAHVAEAMGIVAAETINGAETMPVDFDFVPRATYCNPQIASFGYSEAQAKEKGYDVKTATFPFSANGKAMGLGEPIGFVKVVADAEHNEIIGAHLIGPNVTELLPVLTMAHQWDLTADEVARNVFAHPTLGEAVKEAVHGIAGHMIILMADHVVIIGGGPGGYEAAHVAAQLGAEVTVVDTDGIGGSAVLTDCVPSKTLIATSELMTDMSSAPGARGQLPRPRGRRRHDDLASTWPRSTPASSSSRPTSRPTSRPASTVTAYASCRVVAGSVPTSRSPSPPLTATETLRGRRDHRGHRRRAAHPALRPAGRRADPDLGAGLRPDRGAGEAHRGRVRCDRCGVRQRLSLPRRRRDAGEQPRPGAARRGRRRLRGARGGADPARHARARPVTDAVGDPRRATP